VTINRNGFDSLTYFKQKDFHAWLSGKINGYPAVVNLFKDKVKDYCRKWDRTDGARADWAAANAASLREFDLREKSLDSMLREVNIRLSNKDADMRRAASKVKEILKGVDKSSKKNGPERDAAYKTLVNRFKPKWVAGFVKVLGVDGYVKEIERVNSVLAGGANKANKGAWWAYKMTFESGFAETCESFHGLARWINAMSSQPDFAPFRQFVCDINAEIRRLL
jgi:hypothetical protein